LSENLAPDASEAARQAPQGKLPILGLSALGIVFGDIGTSPLYTFKTILGTAEASPDAGIIRRMVRR
jgi:KUP system potassium uptake protein